MISEHLVPKRMLEKVGKRFFLKNGPPASFIVDFGSFSNKHQCKQFLELCEKMSIQYTVAITARQGLPPRQKILIVLLQYNCNQAKISC